MADSWSVPKSALNIEGTPRYQQIYEYLLNEISEERLKPGDLIPSEKEICNLFDVSRITSKKALEMLVTKDLIFRRRGKGSFVSKIFDPVEIQKKPHLFRTIAFLIPAFNDSFGKSLVYSVEHACKAHGYQLILKLTHESPDEEEKALHVLDEENVAGILMLPVRSEHYNAELLRQILKKRPIVFVDRSMKGLPVPSVMTDNVSASEAAIKQLFNKGHQHVAFYSYVINTSTVEDRLQGYTKAFANNGVFLNSDHIFNNIPMPDSLDVIIRHLTEHPDITAVFTSEFRIAVTVKKALSILNRDNLQDFSLVTFDHPGYTLEFSDFIFLRQNEDAIGNFAVDILHRIIEGESSQSISDILVPAELVS